MLVALTAGCSLVDAPRDGARTSTSVSTSASAGSALPGNTAPKSWASGRKTQSEGKEAPPGGKPSKGVPTASDTRSSRGSSEPTNDASGDPSVAHALQPPAQTVCAKFGDPRGDARNLKLNTPVTQGAGGQLPDKAYEKDPDLVKGEAVSERYQTLTRGSRWTGAVDGGVVALRTLADGKLLISVSQSGQVLIWDLATGHPYSADGEKSRSARHGVRGKGSGVQIAAADIAPERGLAAVWASGALYLCGLGTGEELGVLRLIKSRLSSVVFQPGADAILGAGVDGRVYRWKYRDEAGERNPERYFGPATVVSSVAGLPGGRVIFSGDWAGALTAWLAYDADAYRGSYDENLFRGGMFAESAATKKAPRTDTIAISHVLTASDGAAVYSVLEDGRIEWWMVRGLAKIGEFAPHKGIVFGAALSENGKFLATVGRDGKVKVAGLAVDESIPPKATFLPTFEKVLPGARRVTFTGARSIAVFLQDGTLLSFAF